MVLCQSLGNHLNFLLNTLIIQQATQCSSYWSTQSPKVCPQRHRAAVIRHWDQSSLKKKNSKLPVCMCTQGLEPTEDLAWAGVPGLLGTALLWRSSTGFSTAEASLQPKISTLEQAETASLEGRQLCCMYSFIANLKLHHCSILRSAPKMKRCREGANTPRFLNQGQLVQTWTSSNSTVYLTRSLGFMVEA